MLPKTHLGTFDAAALRRAGSPEPEAPSFLRDLAGALAMLAFCAAVSVVLTAAILPDLPA